LRGFYLDLCVRSLEKVVLGNACDYVIFIKNLCLRLKLPLVNGYVIMEL
jgi:hypothetical protein